MDLLRYMNSTDISKIISCIPCSSEEEKKRAIVSLGAMLNMLPCVPYLKAITDAMGITHTEGREPLSLLSELIASFTSPIISLLSLPNDMIDFIEYGKLPNPIISYHYNNKDKLEEIKNMREGIIDSLRDVENALQNSNSSHVVLKKDTLEKLMHSIIEYFELESKHNPL